MPLARLPLRRGGQGPLRPVARGSAAIQPRTEAGEHVDHVLLQVVLGLALLVPEDDPRTLVVFGSREGVKIEPELEVRLVSNEGDEG